MTPLPTLEQPIAPTEGEKTQRSEIENLKQYYTLRQPEAIASFIEQNRSLLPILQAAPQEIAKYFPGKKLELEYYLDPEYSNDHPGELVLHIQVYSNQVFDLSSDEPPDLDWELPDANLELLKALELNWELPASRTCQHLLFIVLS